MIICVPTVQHTGSFFVTRHLLDGYPEQPIRTDNYASGVYFDHVNPEKRVFWQPLLDCANAIIVPLRHPVIVAESWRRKGKPLDDMYAQWDMLIDFVDPYQPAYLPLDVDIRDAHLGAINERYNLKLQTRWPVINSKVKTYGLDRQNLPIDTQLQQLLDRLDPLLSRFYTH